MKLSARNQIAGTITKVNEGVVNAIVTMEFDDDMIAGTISMAAVKELGLKPGKKACAIIKATEVMIGLGDMTLSARNKLKGRIQDIDSGAVNAIVKIKVAGDNIMSATISMAAVKELGLEPGKEAVAVVKATSVMFGID